MNSSNWVAMSATATGWFNRRPRARRFWARKPALCTNNLSISRGERRMALPLSGPWVISEDITEKTNVPGNFAADILHPLPCHAQQNAASNGAGHGNKPSAPRHGLCGNSVKQLCAMFTQFLTDKGEKCHAIEPSHAMLIVERAVFG